MASSCCVLPEDVLFYILLWLPVASLLRFKSVCKSWYSFIESSRFINEHCHFLRNTDNHLLILDANNLKDVSVPCYSLNFCLLSGNNYQLRKDLELPYRFNEPLEFSTIIASCKGIVCLDHDNQDISLWNPATKQFRLLPKSPVPLPGDMYNDVDVFFGFGYDVKTDDYKVVRVIVEDYYNSKRSRVELYSLYTDSWRPIDCVLPFAVVDKHPRAPFQNGIYCWMGYFRENGLCNNSILSFDFTTEAFGTMSVPDVYRIDNDSFLMMLALLNEKIACLVSPVFSLGKVPCHFEVWVLNEYGVKESWTKLYTTVLEYSLFPCEVFVDRKIVWEKRDSVTGELIMLCLWDPIAQELQDLPCQDILTGFLEVAVYKESLVSIKRANVGTNRDLAENCQPSALDFAVLKLG